MDDVPLCPPWWPDMLWKLHFPPGPVHPHRGGGGDPVNRPVELDRILIALAGYTVTFLHEDRAANSEMREMARKQVIEAAHALGHDA